MDRYSRRERLGLIAIAIAALASAATTASPPPTPDLLSTQKGTISLTAAAPFAWLDFTATENEALTALEGRTLVKVRAEAQVQDVMLLASDLTLYGSTTGGRGMISGQAVCHEGEVCQAGVRLIAILVDPAAHPDAEIAWTATAESHYPHETGPVPDAKLAVEVGPVQTGTAAELGLASTAPETIELGPDLPRAVRNVRLTLPAGTVRDPIVDAGAFLRTTDLDGGPSHKPPARLRVRQGQNLIGNASWSAELMSPFRRCEPGVECEADLLIEFNWNGGSAEGSRIEWSLAAWSGLSTGEPAAPAAIDVEPADVPWDRPDLRASLTGHTEVTDRVASAAVGATLEVQGVPLLEGEIEGLVRFTFRATLAPGADPATEIDVSIGDGLGTQKLRPGGTVIVYSRAEEPNCDRRRPTCTAFSGVRLSRESDDLPAATVTWTADVEFLSLTGIVPKGLTLVLIAPAQ